MSVEVTEESVSSELMNRQELVKESRIWFRDDHRTLVYDVCLRKLDDPALNIWLRKLHRSLGFSKSVHAIDQCLRSTYSMNDDDIKRDWKTLGKRVMMEVKKDTGKEK